MVKGQSNIEGKPMFLRTKAVHAMSAMLSGQCVRWHVSRPSKSAINGEVHGACAGSICARSEIATSIQNRLGSPYRSGRVQHWVKIKNLAAPAVKREAEEDWGNKRWSNARRHALPLR
jgi:hypothetical protein